jgi:ubiquinone/menaquinone biosynthesis C-methylase UbiE
MVIIFPSKDVYDLKDYWEKRIRKFEGRLRSVGHISFSDKVNKYIYMARVKALNRILAENNFSLSGKKVLDSGCGIGYFTEYYSRTDASQVVALDISPTAVKYCVKNVKRADCVIACLSYMPFRTNYFDVVHAFDVLYHITDDYDWKKALTEISRVLSKGGVVVLTEKFIDKSIESSFYIKFRSRKIYLNEIGKVGLTLVDEQGMHFLFRVLDSKIGAVFRIEFILQLILELFPQFFYYLEKFLEYPLFWRSHSAKVVILGKR